MCSLITFFDRNYSRISKQSGTIFILVLDGKYTNNNIIICGFFLWYKNLEKNMHMGKNDRVRFTSGGWRYIICNTYMSGSNKSGNASVQSFFDSLLSFHKNIILKCSLKKLISLLCAKFPASLWLKFRYFDNKVGKIFLKSIYM